MAHLGGAIGGIVFARAVGFGGGARDNYSDPYEQSPQRVPRRVRRAEKRARGKVVEAKVVESEDFVSAEIDPILDKINRDGMGSLTEAERETLRKGQKKIAPKGRSRPLVICGVTAGCFISGTGFPRWHFSGPRRAAISDQPPLLAGI